MNLKLSIKTDVKDTSWLRYVLDEFSEIQDANFEIEISGLDASDENDMTLFYCQKETSGTSIWNASMPAPTGDIVKIENGYISKGTETYLKGFEYSYDLFWNAFIFLSRLDEYLTETETEIRINSYSGRHPRADSLSFQIPMVSVLFEELERLITKKFPQLSFGEGRASNIEYSHDLDYLKKTAQLRLKQTAFNVFNCIKLMDRPTLFLKKIYQTIVFLMTNRSYWHFDDWVNLEQKFNKTSIFYIYVKTYRKKTFKTWLIDPSYDLRRNTLLKAKLKNLIEKGFEIGLHGSYDSAVNQTLLKEEKEILETELDIKISKTRQHWLRYSEQQTPIAHEAIFKQDSSVAWNDCMGFRAGIASAYHPYDHKNKRAFNFKVVPQIVMDSQLFDYQESGSERSIETAFDLIKVVRKIKNAHCSISWHPRTINAEYGWGESYKRLLEA